MIDDRANAETHLNEVRNLLGDPPSKNDAFWALHAPQADSETRAFVRELCADMNPERQAIIVQTLRHMDGQKRAELAEYVQKMNNHMTERYIRELNGRIAEIEDVHSGKAGAMCVPIRNLREAFWKGFALSLGIPIFLLLVGALLAWAYFQGKGS